MALTKIKQVSDGLNDLEVKLQPLQAIATIRSHCNEVLDQSETYDYETTAWQQVNELITELRNITDK